MKTRAHSLALAVVWVLILAYGIYFSAYSIQRHRAFLTNASDLGQIDQAIWNSLQGRPLEFTRRAGEASIRLTDHVEPIFLPTSLVFLLYDNVEALLILQSFVLALGALPVFWIARWRLGAEFAAPADQSAREQQNARHIEVAGVLFATMYLLFPALQAANLAEFHAVTYVPVLVLFAYHYGSLQKWGRLALFSFLLLMVKEEISLLVFMLAGYFTVATTDEGRSTIAQLRHVIRHPSSVLRRWQPLLITAFAAVWFAISVFVIIPQFNALGKSPYTCRYLVGEDCPPVARGAFLEQRLGYLAQLFASSGFVSILDPISLLLGSPLLVANVISNYPAQYSGTFHYSAPVVPYFVLAAIGGTAFLVRRVQQRKRFGERVLLAVTTPVFLIAVAYHLYAGYTPAARAYAFPPITKHNQLFERFAAQIPPSAKVSTTPSLHPHLSHRQVLYRYPVVNDAEYVLLDVNESDRGIPSEFRIAYNDLVNDRVFGVVDAADGYVLLKRGAPQPGLPDAFYTPFRAGEVTPQFPVQIDFEDKIRFLGYDALTDAYGRGYLRTYWQRLKALDKNYVLSPFVADETGAPVTDLNFPMTCLFWYPTAAWQKDETIVCKTIPLEWGERVRLGVGVSASFDWSEREARLRITRAEPSILRVKEETWVELGALVREGGGFERHEK